jgi:hypothetical protein
MGRDTASGVGVVDREARDELAALLERYLNEETGAFSLRDESEEIGERTEDETVGWAVFNLYLCYDDFKDHKVVASKEGWDWFQRLLLLLRSDASVRECKRWRWSVRQLFAAAGVLAFVYALAQLGSAESLFAVCLPLGAASMLLSYWRRRADREEWSPVAAIWPFPRGSVLLAIRRAVPAFRKRPYPTQLAGRAIRTPLEHGFMLVPFWGLWALFSPLVLLNQSFPERVTHMEVLTNGLPLPHLTRSPAA